MHFYVSCIFFFFFPKQEKGRKKSLDFGLFLLLLLLFCSSELGFFFFFFTIFVVSVNVSTVKGLHTGNEITQEEFTKNKLIIKVCYDTGNCRGQQRPWGYQQQSLASRNNGRSYQNLKEEKFMQKKETWKGTKSLFRYMPNPSGGFRRINA